MNPLDISGRRAVIITDLVLGLWALVWVGVAVWIYLDLRDLNSMALSVRSAGQALVTTANALNQVGSLPLVGGSVSHLAAQIRQAGENAQLQGQVSKSAVRELSLLLAFAVGVIPSVPLLVLYLPARVRRRREQRRLHRALFDDSPGLEEFLARRAVQHLPFHVVAQGGNDPWSELKEGRYRRLADLELDRVGVARPAPAARLVDHGAGG